MFVIALVICLLCNKFPPHVNKFSLQTFIIHTYSKGQEELSWVALEFWLAHSHKVAVRLGLDSTSKVTHIAFSRWLHFLTM